MMSAGGAGTPGFEVRALRARLIDLGIFTLVGALICALVERAKK